MGVFYITGSMSWLTILQCFNLTIHEITLSITFALEVKLPGLKHAVSLILLCLIYTWHLTHVAHRKIAGLQARRSATEPVDLFAVCDMMQNQI